MHEPSILPTIPGVTPEVVSSSMNPYTVIGNQVIWEQQPPTNSFNEKLVLRVRYPKDQVDAAGGLSAMVDLTNKIEVDFILAGNVPDTKSAEITFDLRPVPSPIYGKDNSHKAAYNYSTGGPLPGAALYSSDIPLIWAYFGLTSGSNIVPISQTITEDFVTFETVAGNSDIPGYDEMQWVSIRVEAPAGVVEYQTTAGEDTWYTMTNIRIPAPNLVYYEPFPTLPNGVYISRWRVTGTGMTNPNERIAVRAITTLKQRTQEQPILYKITNQMNYQVNYPDGTTRGGIHEASLSVQYYNKTEQRFGNVIINKVSVLPSERFSIQVGLFVMETTSVIVLGTTLSAIIPRGLNFDSVTTDSAGGPTEYNVIPNWNAEGDTLLQVYYLRSSPALIRTLLTTVIWMRVDSLSPAAEYSVPFYYTLNPEQANDPTIDHMATLTTNPDIYDFDEDGNRDELVAYASGNIHVITASIVNVLKLSKSMKDVSFQINNNTQITSGEQFQYKFFIRNDSTYPMTNPTMIDIFPYVGDVFGSMWAPIFVEVVLLPEGASILYSLSTNPDMRPIEETGSDPWFVDPPSDFTLIRAIKMVFNNRIFLPGEQTEVIIQMKAPADVVDFSKSYNSINYITSAIINGTVVPYLPAFSPPAYAQLTFRDFDTLLGDFVWNDLNRDGIQDIDEPGINDVLVSVYNDQLELMYQTNTQNNPDTGEPGYYEFRGLWPGNYYLLFPPILTIDEEEYTLTSQNQGTDGNIDSKPNFETGFTELITIEDGEQKLTIDAGYIYSSVANGSIGDFVWFDANGNGIQDPGESGINGVLVRLLDDNGDLLASTETIDSPITGEAGYYSFSGLFPGYYQVEFPASLPDGTILTLQRQGNDPEKNSAPDPYTNLTELTFLNTGENRLDMDAGYRLPDAQDDGIIGDFVWLDLNRNGIQDPGETGINGVLVTLLSSLNLQVASMTTITDEVSGNSGYYLFQNLPQDVYRVYVPPILPNGYTLTLPLQGSDTEKNSKPNSYTGYTEEIELGAGERRLDIDAGYITPIIAPEDIIIKTVDKHKVFQHEKITFRITFQNNSGKDIIGLRIFDIPDHGYFEYTGALCRINSEISPITMSLESNIIVIVVQVSVPVDAIVEIEVFAFARKEAPAGSYFDYAYAEYDNTITNPTPSVKVIIKEKPIEPCKPSCTCCTICRPQCCSRCRCHQCICRKK